jgi:hypothetical protein
MGSTNSWCVNASRESFFMPDCPVERTKPEMTARGGVIRLGVGPIPKCVPSSTDTAMRSARIRSGAVMDGLYCGGNEEQ